MERNIYHSAEGSTWTKKNHKYIRKEGNRYIYPDDVKNGRRVGDGPIQRTKNKTARDILSEKGIRNVRYQDLPAYNRVSNSLEPSVSRHRNTITKDKDGNYRNTTNYKSYDGSVRTVEIPGTENYRYRDEIKANKIKERQAENRSNAMNNQGSADYKQLSQQRLNRKAAANGQVVNPIATWRGSNGQVIAREKTNEKISAPTTSDYKQYSKERSNGTKRKAAAGSPNEYVQNQEHAKKMTMIRHAPSINPIKYKNGIGPSPDSLDRRINAMKKQGTVNHQQEAKDKKKAIDIAKKAVKEYEKNHEANTKRYAEQVEASKSYQDMVKKADNKKVKASKEYYDELRSNTRNEKEFNDYLDEHNIARPDGSKPTVSKSNKVETWDNSKNIKTWDDVDKEIDKKSTNGKKGTFTLGEDGQTKFVPESENKPKKKSNKALEKGKAVIDSIRKRIKKKDKKK